MDAQNIVHGYEQQQLQVLMNDQKRSDRGWKISCNELSLVG